MGHVIMGYVSSIIVGTKTLLTQTTITIRINSWSTAWKSGSMRVVRVRCHDMGIVSMTDAIMPVSSPTASEQGLLLYLFNIMKLVFGNIDHLAYARNGGCNEWILQKGHRCNCSYCEIDDDDKYECPHCNKSFFPIEINEYNNMDFDSYSTLCPSCKKLVYPYETFAQRLRGY